MTTANEESGSYSSLTAEVTPQSVLTLLCPWTKEIPTHLRQRLHWSPTPLPEGEIHDPTALILYAGDDDPTSLHQAMLQESQHWPVQILEIDNKRPGKAIEHDMLREEPYGRLCRAAMQGKLRALLGGPNCRTWWFPKPGAPQPVRGRHPDLTWGLPGIRLRLTYMIFPQVDWGFVFVDDFCWILRQGTATAWATTLLATYVALGVPLSWKRLCSPEPILGWDLWSTPNPL